MPPNVNVVITDPVEEPAADPQEEKSSQEIKEEEAPKEEPGKSQPDSTEEDQKSEEEKKLLGKSPEEITKEEAVKAALKSDEEVEKLRQRVKELENPAPKVEEEKTEEEEEVDLNNLTAEQETAIAVLRDNGFATKAEIIAELKAEQELDRKAESTVSRMTDIVEKYKDTPIKTTLEELTTYMEENKETDPEKAFKLMKYDAMVAFEAAKASGKDPLQTEEKGKEPYKPETKETPGMSKYNINNPNIDSVIEEELGNKSI